ncbi:hypothetical protein GCM10009127_01800 [Alteraurantiacibacter aestuarii]|uniref:Uncharacterized protein n=1 Tax=Alteraurantiacibacter aestuarii TaxID=650004 RepID=A0A844ZP18_9SPHN|nr:hypothetical protein [Alteraurantiacibacter aestuarii]MXO88567.1 hypothetical protein [Alteraurantiacibacter aestuarii]
MAQTKTTSQTIAELREFASFTAEEQLFIERSLDVGLGRGDAFKSWVEEGGSCSAIRGQYIAYRELRALRGSVPSIESLDGVAEFIGALVRMSAADLAQEQLSCFSAYRFLYERLLGAPVRPWLPAAFCGAAALPQIRPERRKMLLQSLSEAAATAPAWSTREPGFFPERIEDEAA